MTTMRTSESISPCTSSEYFDADTDNGDLSITIQAQQMIGNPTGTAGYITFKRTGNTCAERDYFAAGQYKFWVVDTIYGADGGTSGLAGSTCRVCVTGGYTGTGDAIGTTTTTAAPTTTTTTAGA